MPLADWPLVTTGVTSTVDAHGLSPTEVLTAPPVDLTPHRVDLTQHRVEPHIDTRGPDPASRGPDPASRGPDPASRGPDKSIDEPHAQASMLFSSHCFPLRVSFRRTMPKHVAAEPKQPF